MENSFCHVLLIVWINTSNLEGTLVFQSLPVVHHKPRAGTEDLETPGIGMPSRNAMEEKGEERGRLNCGGYSK